MTTANAIITDALGSLGVIGAAETVSGNDAVLGLRVLNRLIDAWRQQPNMALNTTWVSFTLPANTATRTIGPTGQVVATRPVEIAVGSFTRLGGIDRPLEVVTVDQYGSADLKSQTGSWPRAVYYEATSPNGTLYFWPLAGTGAEIFLAVRAQLSKFADLTTDYVLPDGYEAAIVPSLAEKLAPFFERPVPDGVARDAMNGRRALKRTNASVPTLDMEGQPGRSRLGEFLGGE